MNTQLAVKQWAIVMHNGLIAWENEEEVEKLKAIISAGVKMVELSDGSLVPAQSISVLSPLAYDTWSKQQRGMWKCKYNGWHTKNESCECGRAH